METARLKRLTEFVKGLFGCSEKDKQVEKAIKALADLRRPVNA
jgi:hypothetical protein